MKILKMIFYSALMLAVFSSCQKEEALKNISGTWEGNWGFGTDAPSFYEKWDLEENGTLTAYDLFDGVYATGTWTLEGDEFEAQYSPVGESYGYTFSGFFVDELDQISGSWGESPSAINGGTFEMHKQ